MDKGILIGEDEFIEWIDFDYKNSNPTDIDILLLKTKELWTGLELDCVAECCGIDAFCFQKNDIQVLALKLDCNSLLFNLEELKQNIQNLENDELISRRLNNLFHKEVFIKLIDHISNQIKDICC